MVWEDFDGMFENKLEGGFMEVDPNQVNDDGNALNNNENDVGFYHNVKNNEIPSAIRNVKIIGLNVCGLRPKLRNGIFEEFAKQYDILCLSEIILAMRFKRACNPLILTIF